MPHKSFHLRKKNRLKRQNASRTKPIIFNKNGNYQIYKANYLGWSWWTRNKNVPHGHIQCFVVELDKPLPLAEIKERIANAFNRIKEET